QDLASRSCCQSHGLTATLRRACGSSNALSPPSGEGARFVAVKDECACDERMVGRVCSTDLPGQNIGKESRINPAKRYSRIRRRSEHATPCLVRLSTDPKFAVGTR